MQPLHPEESTHGLRSGCDHHIVQFDYSGIEAKATPFRGVDEADNCETVHRLATVPEFYILWRCMHDQPEAVVPPE